MQFQEWGDQVTVVSSDMRELESISIKVLDIQYMKKFNSLDTTCMYYSDPIDIMIIDFFIIHVTMDRRRPCFMKKI